MSSSDTNYVAHDSNRGSVTPRGARGRPQPFHNTGSGRNTPTRGMETPRGRGRGAGSDWYPSGGRRGKGGIGDTSPRGRGKGRHAGGGSRLRPDAAPLSSLLYEERPLLRPVVFVRSVLTTTLFEEEDEIFRPVTEEIGEECCSVLFLLLAYEGLQVKEKRVMYRLPKESFGSSAGTCHAFRIRI